MKPFYEVRSQTLFVGQICSEPFPLHVHEVVEIVHMQQGTLDVTIGAQKYQLSPGDTVIMFPAISHSYDVVPKDAAGLCVIFLPETILEFVETFRRMRPVRPLLPASEHDAGLLDAANRLSEVAKVPDSPLVKGYLHVFLSHLLSRLELEPTEMHVDMGLTQQVMEYLSEHYREDITLESVAKELGISRSHLSHIFSEQLNVNFRRYINTLRIDQAGFLLQNTAMTVTEIGYACGYNNLRTFHRAFQNERGMQPGEYRLARRKTRAPNNE